MKTSYKKFILGLIFAATLMPFVAQAITVPNTYTPLAPLPCIQGNGVTCPNNVNGAPVTSVTFQTYVQYTFNLLIALAAVAAVFMIVYGGFEYMTSSAVNTKEDGLKKVYNAVGGLVLVLCSYLILKTINPQFVQIPSNLVAPLNATSTNASADWLNALSNVMSVDTLNANNAAARQTVADATAASTVLQQQLANDQKNAADVCDFDSDSYDPEACGIANNAIAADQDQLNQLQSSTTLTVAKQMMDNLVSTNGCSPMGDPQSCAAQAQKIAAVYTSVSGQLQPDQLKQLQNQALYDQAIANMDGQAAAFYQKGAVSSPSWLSGLAEGLTGNTLISSKDPTDYQNTLTAIDNIANSYINSPGADPTLVAQLKTQQQNIKALVKNMTYHITQ